MDCQLLEAILKFNESEEENQELMELKTRLKEGNQELMELKARLKEENQELMESKMQLKMLEQRRIQLKTLLKAENRKRKEIETQGKMLEQSGQRPAPMSCSTCEGSSSNKCGRCQNSLCLICQLTGFRKGSYIQWCIGCEKVMCPACTRKGFICRRCTCFICEICSKCFCDQNIYDPEDIPQKWN